MNQLVRQLSLLTVALFVSTAAQADPGHDHGDAPPAATGSSPRRQADGGVFLPKPAQRQIDLRTQVAAQAQWPRALPLSGQVVMDPNAGGRVQAAISGRIQAPRGGLPSPGQQVRQGQVLAYVAPTAGAIELSNQQAQQAELRAAKVLAERRLERLQALSDTVAHKEIEAAAAEVASLRERLQAVNSGLSRRDALVAPVAGVIASADAIAGKVVQAGELVFEVVDPRRLRIEALAYEPEQAQQIGSASLVVGDTRVPLRFIGAARRLRDQALPLSFTGDAAALSKLALGQTVQVVAQTSEMQPGIAVPIASLVRNPSNQDIVWIKAAPERFEPRVVTHAPIDGSQVRLTSGVKAGERVVIRGASLLNQIR